MILPTSGPDDIFGHVLGCQRLEPLVDLFRGLFVPPETGDREGYGFTLFEGESAFILIYPNDSFPTPILKREQGRKRLGLTSLYHARLDLRHPDWGIIQLLHHGHGEPPQGMLGSAVDRTAGVPFSTGNGAELDDVTGVVLLEVCDDEIGRRKSFRLAEQGERRERRVTCV